MLPKQLTQRRVRYEDIPGVNFSTLKMILESPLHYQHAISSGWAETRAMSLGEAAHMAALQPELFAARYARAPDPAPRRGTVAWRALEGEHAGKIVLKPDDYDAAASMAQSVRAHLVARELLRSGIAEAPLVWADSGIACKGRVDWIGEHNGGVVLLDLKTSRDVRPVAFGRAAAGMRYPMQVAMYLRGLRAMTGASATPYIIAVENRAPHDVVVYDFPVEAVELGESDLDEALTILRQCQTTGRWPGRSDCCLALQLPRYIYPSDDDVQDLGLDFGG
jgi:hypothetical protein